MDRDRHFLALLEKCKQALEKTRDSFAYNDDKHRWKLMMEEVEGLINTVLANQLNRNMQTLTLTHQMQRDDPELVVNSVIEVWKFYRDNYQEEW